MDLMEDFIGLEIKVVLWAFAKAEYAPKDEVIDAFVEQVRVDLCVCIMCLCIYHMMRLLMLLSSRLESICVCVLCVYVSIT
jgi:hypothetical protein